MSADAETGRYTLTIELRHDGEVRCFVEAAEPAPGVSWSAAIEVDPADPLVARALRRARARAGDGAEAADEPDDRGPIVDGADAVISRGGNGRGRC